MRAFFSIIKLFFFGIWSFIAIVLGAILFVFRWKSGMAWIAKYFWSPVVLRLLQARLSVKNIERIDPTENYLIVANHSSFIDIPVLFKTLPFYTYFVAKKELRKVPLLGWYIKAYGMIFIDRSDRKKAQASISHAANLVANGKHVIIFPEGTKSKDGMIAPFKKGGFHLAEQAKVAILPIKIEGAGNVWPNKKSLKLKRGHITIKIGTPIKHEELMHTEIGERAVILHNLINTM